MASGRPPSLIQLRRATATLLGVLLFLSPHAARSDTQSQLSQAKARLSSLENKIAAEKQQLAADKAQIEAVQGKLNNLAGDMAKARDRCNEVESQVMAVRDELRAANDHYRSLRGRLDQRARIAYETGPVADLTFLLSANSLSDLSDRVAFVTSLNQNDTDLANNVQDQANALNMKRRALDGLLARQTAVLRVLQRKQQELDAQFESQRGIYDQEVQLVAGLTNDAAQVDHLVARLQSQLQSQELLAARRAAQQVVINGPGPFRACPVQGPHAYSDDFGAPRTTTNPPHPHAGNDILAPKGTPIVAPFDGVATNASGGLGGNAVIVRGADGYVYNAHLDSFGTLGQVKAGTVVGYVGNSGDAIGGATHDHFEWHPAVIPPHPWRSPYGFTVVNTAIDPFPYLNMVC